MQFYRTTSHTRYDIKLHFVWITKYRKPILTENVTDEVIMEYIESQEKEPQMEDEFKIST